MHRALQRSLPQEASVLSRKYCPIFNRQSIFNQKSNGDYGSITVGGRVGDALHPNREKYLKFSERYWGLKLAKLQG